jgi:hypothetical protein
VWTRYVLYLGHLPLELLSKVGSASNLRVSKQNHTGILTQTLCSKSNQPVSSSSFDEHKPTMWVEAFSFIILSQALIPLVRVFGLVVLIFFPRVVCCLADDALEYVLPHADYELRRDSSQGSSSRPVSSRSSSDHPPTQSESVSHAL